MARDVTTRFIGKDELSPVANKIGGSLSGLGKQIGAASSEAGVSTGMFSKLGSALGGIATVAGGIIAANVFSNLAGGIRSFVSAGLEAVGSSQLLEQRLNSLFASNMLYSREATGALDEFGNAIVGWVPNGLNLAQVQGKARAEAEKLVAGIEQLAKVSPFPTEEIKQIGAYGVQMGMSADKALEFTSTMTNMGLALGLPAHEIVRMAQNLKQMQGMSKLTTIDMREMERRG